MVVIYYRSWIRSMKNDLRCLSFYNGRIDGGKGGLLFEISGNRFYYFSNFVREICNAIKRCYWKL